MACQGLIETEISTVGGISIKYFSKQSVLGLCLNMDIELGQSTRQRAQRILRGGLWNHFGAGVLASDPRTPGYGADLLPWSREQDTLLSGIFQTPTWKGRITYS